MPIPAEATAVHGISDEDIKRFSTFKELAPKIIDMIKDSDLGVLIRIDLIFHFWRKNC